MKWARRAYLHRLALLYHASALTIQRFCKGYAVQKKYKQTLHDAVIERMMTHFRKLKFELNTNSQIKIRFAFKVFDRRKKRKEEAKKAKAAKSKKKGKFGSARKSAAPTPTTPLIAGATKT